jgi:hypothetical protein
MLMLLNWLERCTASASTLYTTNTANQSMINQTENKKPCNAEEKKTSEQPQMQLSSKTLEFMAKLQKIHDNVLRDISDL